MIFKNSHQHVLGTSLINQRFLRHHPDFPRLKLTAGEATIATQSVAQETAIDVAELVCCILKETQTGVGRPFDHQLLERSTTRMNDDGNPASKLVSETA